jgi:hypothetical protein
MKVYGEWRYSSTILDLSTRWRWVISFKPRLLYPWETGPSTHLGIRLGGPPDPVWTLWNRKKLSPVLKLTSPRPARSPSLQRGLISLWLYKENNKLRDWKMYLLYIFPMSSTHLWLRCSNFFNPSKKNSFGCGANKKRQKLISTPTYIDWAGPAYHLSADDV